MAEIEKGSGAHNSMPPPPSYQPGSSATSFNPKYEHFVNENMQNFGSAPAGPVQAFDKIQEPKRSKYPSKKRQMVYFAIGCLLILAMTLIGIFVLGRHHKDDKEVRDEPTAQAVTVTQTAIPSTSSASISVSVSVSVSTVISRKTETETKTKTKITTVATTAPIPTSIANAASSFYGAMSSSIQSELAKGSSINADALTRYTSFSTPPTTLMTTTTPPPVTVVQTTTATASTGERNVLCPEDEWFC